ncbi:endonuclease/exonuclease/phosphatase [Oculatella sp. FACHB-28]|uniref:endonuclease/exonuclease/phosphatase family protein n=1 Tax=Oculatella sp. FACHB-28 TaxID=2692845 RepID=UPI001682294D|nr:endonuclease/exonuclease/phosphatase family protein [Oculatella sp. FACHB-28]MBD2059585.1 endonuclease/exonuclease/phosphatase [Oculatella sp. FACHB-28]
MNSFSQIRAGLIGSVLVTLISSITISRAASAEDLTVVSFNVESGGSDPIVMATQQMAPLDGVDVWGLSEVQNEAWVNALETGAEAGEQADFDSILGTTGGGDRLAILYNSTLLEAVRHEELDELNLGGNVRAALVAQFRLRQTGEEFLFVVNHLYRSETELRHEQSRLLNAWVQEQSLPVIAVGDYNFDFNVTDGDQGDRDAGFDLLTQNEAFVWIRPKELVATFCSTKYNSILDFVFVANAAKTWTVESSEVLFADPTSNYCPDDEITSDHRPIEATFQLPSDQADGEASLSQPGGWFRQVLQAIASLVRSLQS